MDTKWIKFKYSSLNKFLCALLAAVLAGLCCVSSVTVLRHISYFGGDGLINNNKVGYINTLDFAIALNEDLVTIIDDVSHNTNQAAYDAAKEATVSLAVSFVNYSRSYLEDYKDQISAYSMWENGYTSTYTEYPQLDIPYAAENYSVYALQFDEYEDYFYFEMDVQDEILASQISFDSTDIFSKSEEELTNLFNTQFGNTVYYDYCHTTSDAGESAALGLKNIRYYAEFADGSVATNVEDTAALINAVRNGEGEYFLYENGSSRSSDALSRIAVYSENFYGDTAEDLRLYVSVDPNFTQNDRYDRINANLSGIAAENANAALYIAVIALFGCIFFAVISLRLAGNRSDGTVAAAAADKLPLDIGFILAGGAVFVLGMLLFAFYASEQYAIFGYEYNYYFTDISSGFFTSQLYKNILFAIGAAVYLILLGFSLSVARNAKTGVNIFKHTFIYMACSLIFRLLKRAFMGIKNFFGTIAFLPKQLDKRAVRAVTLFSFFNIVSMGVVSLIIASAPYGGGNVLLGLFLLCALLAADAFCVYKAFQFVRSLDRLIDCSVKNEPVDIDTSKLPQSLKTLAESLDKKNAELQQAVIKAVKDERTKAELITNVSHDLKTPLTSVINYIDLLKKCDIQDETALKYMGVIDDKANRLKRLIEDLIEASKVSTGNVVLNKTKINLNELTTQAIVEYADDFEKNNLNLIFEETAQKHIVFADGTKIYRVFENLLSNAQKYSAPGTRVYARLYSGRNFSCFEIKNISKEPLNISAEELTERFVRGDKARTEEGNGLGLSIAKELCRLNGGKLTLSIDGDLFKATVMLPNAQENEDENEKQD